jgi:O-antigen/teichoic acid export membrane protein
MDVARSSTKVFLANFGGAVLTLLGITFFAREIGAGALGTFFLFQAALGILTIPADLGLRSATEKRLSEGEDRAEFLGTAVLLKAVPVLAIVGLVVLFRGHFDAYFDAELAVLLAVGVVLDDASKLMLKALQGELRVGATAVLRFAKNAVWIGLGAVLVVEGYGAYGLVYSYLAGIAVVFLWGFHRRSTPFGRPSAEAARSLFDYAKFDFVSKLGGTFYLWMDVAIIGLFLSNAHVGAYEVAWRLTTFVVLFSSAIGTSLLPQISEWDARGDRERIEDAIEEVLGPSLLLVIPALFGSLVLAPEILGFVFGVEFAVAAVALVVLMGEKVFHAVHVIVGRSLLAVDRPDLAARASVVSLTVNVVLNLVLVWEFGIVGAAVGTLIASVVNDVLHYVYLSRFVAVRIPFGEIGWCVGASTAMAGVLLATREVVAVDSLPVLVGFVALGAVVYGSLVLLSRDLRFKIARFLPVSIRG